MPKRRKAAEPPRPGIVAVECSVRLDVQKLSALSPQQMHALMDGIARVLSVQGKPAERAEDQRAAGRYLRGKVNMKHTPPPWKAEQDYGRRWISAKRGKVQIADVADIETGVGSGEVDVDEDQTAANHALLTSAPLMLKELQECLREFQAAAADREGEERKFFEASAKRTAKAIRRALGR